MAHRKSPTDESTAPVPVPPPAPPNDLFDAVAGDAPPEKSKVLAPQVEQNGAFVGDQKSIAVKKSSLGDEFVATRESTAVAAQVQALIAARTLHALKNPRSFMDARVAILRDCERPGFAKAAIYKKPVGGKNMEGLSIRFAEAALRHWGNCGSESILLYDGDDKRIVRILVGDFESNVWHSRDITILKAVERLTLKPGQEAISERINSNGKMTYLVPATDDEMQVKEGAARSKVLRNEGLRLIPADILEEALEACRLTNKTTDAKDPDAAKKNIADSFAELNIMPSDLAEYLGCEIDQASPPQLADLRAWFVAVRDGDTTWQAIMDARVSDLKNEGDDETTASNITSLKNRAKAAAAERKAKAENEKKK